MQNNWAKGTEITNKLRELADFFPNNVRQETLRSYAERLIDYPIPIIDRGLEQLKENAGSFFPSFAEVKAQIVPYIPQERDAREAEHKKKYDNETIKYKSLLDRYMKTLGHTKLFDYYDKWSQVQMGPNYKENLTPLDIDSKMFLKSAVFDLGEAFGDVDKALAICRRKRNERP